MMEMMEKKKDFSQFSQTECKIGDGEKSSDSVCETFLPKERKDDFYHNDSNRERDKKRKSNTGPFVELSSFHVVTVQSFHWLL